MVDPASYLCCYIYRENNLCIHYGQGFSLVCIMAGGVPTLYLILVVSGDIVRICV